MVGPQQTCQTGAARVLALLLVLEVFSDGVMLNEGGGGGLKNSPAVCLQCLIQNISYGR